MSTVLALPAQGHCPVSRLFRASPRAGREANPQHRPKL